MCKEKMCPRFNVSNAFLSYLFIDIFEAYLNMKRNSKEGIY